uniref:Kaptin n=1 Tax=Clastoptera arizonana TaxID=38151 RepID=A0A1B6CK78_9HEMI
MDNFINAHFFSLPSQGNIYSFTKLSLINGINKLLVASLKRKIYSFDYTENAEQLLQPNLKEIAFTYIPNGAEIISIDAFNKSVTCNDFCIGITIIKPNLALSDTEGPSTETYLNIYTEHDIDATFNLENIAQNCLILELNFIPYQLYHAELLPLPENHSCDEIGWLVSGSDFKIHVFKEDILNHTYYEVDASDFFPEFKVMPSVITWFSLEYANEKTRRISAIGCECGHIQLSVVCTITSVVLNIWTELLDGSVSNVLVLKFQSKVTEPPEKFKKFFESKEINTEDESSNFHLLVVNTLKPSLVFMDVMNNGLAQRKYLSGSDQFDMSTCGAIADLDFDGQMEILIGCYAEVILMYKYNGEKWVLRSRYKLANPIHGLKYLDLTGDGVKELAVLTLTGVHVLQHNPKDIYRKFINRLKKLMGKSYDLEDFNKDDEDSENGSILSEQENLTGLDSESTCEEGSEPSQDISILTVLSENLT